MIRVFIVDDHPVVRNGLRALLNTQPNIVVVVDPMKKVFILGLVLSFVLLGEVAPRLLIGPNVKTFQGEQRAFAASAWKEARYFFSGSAEPLFWTAIQVHDVREKTDADGQRCYEADVRAYTLFGLPWSSVRVTSCNGGSAIRQKWGLASLIIGTLSCK